MQSKSNLEILGLWGPTIFPDKWPDPLLNAKRGPRGLAYFMVHNTSSEHHDTY